jgi:hypothetical protein
MATPEQLTAMKEYMVHALNDQGDYETALYLATRLDEGKFRVLSKFDLDDDDEVDAFSLAYQVEVLVADGWAPLCSIHWTRLGLSMDDVLVELASIKAQHEMGIGIDDLDDPID